MTFPGSRLPPSSGNNVRRAGDQRVQCIDEGSAFRDTLIDGSPCTILLLIRNNFTGYVQQHPMPGVKLLMEIAWLISLRLRQTSGLLVDATGA
jgi:hypothetical protein